MIQTKKLRQKEKSSYSREKEIGRRQRESEKKDIVKTFEKKKKKGRERKRKT